MQIITNSLSQKGGALAAKIINKMSGLGKPRKKFMIHIMVFYMCVRGAMFSRGWGAKGVCAKKLPAAFCKTVRFFRFQFIVMYGNHRNRFILAFDPSFLPKSGKLTCRNRQLGSRLLVLSFDFPVTPAERCVARGIAARCL